MKRLTNEELAQIRERVEKATRGEWTFVPIVDSLEYFIAGENGQEAVASEIFMLNDADFIAHAREDVPKLLAEVEYRRGKQAELLEYNRIYLADIKRMSAEIERLREDKHSYDEVIRNLDALAESVRYQLRRHQDAESVADEIIEIISDLERKVGDIV